MTTQNPDSQSSSSEPQAGKSSSGDSTANSAAPVRARTAPPPARVVRKKRRYQALIWLVPIVAALVGLSIVWHEVANRGPKITISFHSAAGLEEGKTQVRYRDVVVGLVEDIRLSERKDAVIAQVQLDKDAEGLAGDGTVFWVVRPTIGLEGISGLGTLLSGAYIEADTERDFAASPNKFHFVGLEEPPPIKSDQPGRHFKLRSQTLGSLSQGTPVYFRRIPVGIVTGYDLDENGEHVDVQVFIHAPYDRYVTGNTRFWNESGLYFNVGADGLTVRTESLASIISGGLAFANFGQPVPLEPDRVFKIYTDRQQAEQLPTGLSIPVTMRFAQSGRGLTVGAPINFQGLTLGRVDQVELQFDRKDMQLYTLVKGTLYPSSLGAAFAAYMGSSHSSQDIAQHMVGFVERGLRAQMKTANILSGSTYIALNIDRNQPLTTSVAATLPFEIPTVRSESLDDLQRKLNHIIDQIGKVPFEDIGVSLQASLEQLRKFTQDVDQSVTPELVAALQSLRQTLARMDGILAKGEQLPAQVDASLQEMERTIESAQSLIDELRAQPDSLIFGVPTQPYSRDTLGTQGGP